jgi:Tol biopolymer transport system component
MPLSTGARLGPYEILSPIGAGGMGEVYKGRDTRLERIVAIKVLPPHLSSDTEFRERFEREARSISALNHPNICTLYDVGREVDTQYLVLEYLEGETLAARIARGPLPLAEALKIATEITNALDKAHRQGIIHRDLKPGNVVLTKTGAKLLDFGLAKSGAAVSAAAASELPTGVAPLTAKGTILGTFQYMAPEQIEGDQADARSDIFAFGAVLFEMLTGRKAFTGKSHASLLGAILKEDPPPVSQVVPVTPPALDYLVRTCLAKDPDARYQTAHDIGLQLRWIAEGGSAAGLPAPVAVHRRRRGRALWMAAGLVLMAVAFAAAWWLKPPPPSQVVRFRLEFPEGVTMAANTIPVLSPDGSRILVSAGTAKNSQFWIRSLDSPAMHPVPGTEGARGPVAFSPDSRSLAYMSGPNLRRIDLVGGASQSLCDLQGTTAGPFAWNREGVILAAAAGVIQKVSASGGAPKPVTELAAGEGFHAFPRFLPDGQHFVYITMAVNPNTATGVTNVGSLDDPKFRKRILQGTGPATYASPGWLLFTRDSVLLAQRFDAGSMELSGEPRPVAEQVGGNNNMDGFAYSVSETGSLAWRLGSTTASQLTWFDRGGNDLGSVGERGEVTNPVLSPDGKRVLIAIRDPGTKTRDLWILELARGASSRLTFDPAEDFNPVWTPDGANVIFSSTRKGHRDIYRKRADGVGGDEELLVSDAEKNVESLSPDGKYLLYNVQPPDKPISIWSLPLTGDPKPALVIAGPRNANYSQFSPNGRWIAYTSQESGRIQVYVRSAPGSGLPEGKWQVSVDGGQMPQWRHDGKEIFFLAGNTLMAAPVQSDGTRFDSGTPAPLFTARLGLSRRNHFTVSADGQRFLFASPAGADHIGDVDVLLNWPAPLKAHGPSQVACRIQRPHPPLLCRGRREMNQLTGFQIHGDRIVRNLGRRSVRCRVIFNAQLPRVHDDPKVAIIPIVVTLEGDAFGRRESYGSPQRRFPRPRQRRQPMSPVSGNDVGDLHASGRAGIPLIAVRVPGKNRVWPHSGRFADGVDLRQHGGAAGMSPRGVRRMVHGEDQRSRELLLVHPCQRSLEKTQLDVGQIGVSLALTGDYSRVFQPIAVERQNPHKGRFERVVDARLDHGRSIQAPGVPGLFRRRGAEVVPESLQGRGSAAGSHHPVVIARDGDDRARIGAVGLIELVVVILGLAEAVDDVAQMEEK